MDKDCFKIRLAIESKGKGKSGGARVIIVILIEDNEVHLLTIYGQKKTIFQTKKLKYYVARLEYKNF